MQNGLSAERQIVIAGGGASGTLLLIHLLRIPGFKGKVTVVNNRYPLGKGIAYSTQEKEHLLNVRAGRMSLFSDRPDDFSEWIRSKEKYSKYHVPDLNEKFVPREAFGEYILERLDELTRSAGKSNQIELLEDEVTDLEQNATGYTVILGSGKKIEAENVVLATGNIPPQNIPGMNDLRDNRVQINPWDVLNSENLDSSKDVLILGSGLTMADTVLSLEKNNFNGRIHILSRHGKFPVTHPPSRPSSHPDLNFEPSKDLNQLYRQIKERIREVIDKDLHWQEPVLEAIRPHTQLLWQQFNADQKQRFLRHLNHRWSILRHRIPAEVAAKLHSLIKEGRLQVHTGRLMEIDCQPEQMQVKFLCKPHNVPHVLEVQRIFNCTGPEANPENSPRQLMKNLLNKGLIRPDSLKLGFDALPDGSLIGVSGKVSPDLYTLGPGLRGILWESTAIPEIRIQAMNLAERLNHK